LRADKFALPGHWQNKLVAAKFTAMVNGTTKQEIETLFETLHLPDLGPGPRPGIKSEAELEKYLDQAFSNSDAKVEQRELVSALVLLWHDRLDAAHEIAQEIDNPTGSFVHGIMHRREPDYGNAAYWFRRVGTHPAFAEIANRAGKALEAQVELKKELISGGEWDPFAFVSACERASRNSSQGDEKKLLQELQVVESMALFDWLCRD
jgi:hypothetical protein